MTVAAAITQLVHIKAFFLGGFAKFTLVSKVTGERKTFRVRKADDKSRFWFVDLMVGPDNSFDFRYLCNIHESAGGRLVARSNKQLWAADAFGAIVWLTAWFNAIGGPAVNESKFFDQCEFWHAGECSRCGRELTDPESIAIGLGPVCREKGA